MANKSYKSPLNGLIGPSVHSIGQLPANNIAQNEVKVQLKEVLTGTNGNVDLVLSLNVQELLKHIDVKQMNNGEATRNPVPFQPGFRIPNKDLCKNTKGLKYLIYVHTSPENRARRMNIRNTWGNRNLFKDGRTNIIFLMGVPDDNGTQEEVLKENQQYQDIVQADFLDVYRNLTIKGIAGLKWVSHYCPQAKFAIKADDDAFVNIFELSKVLERNKNYKKVVACPLWGENSMPILRDPKKCMKWCVKYDEFPGQSYFPQYCAGLSFAISGDLIPEVFNKSFTTPSFWVDDVYVTGLLLGKVKHVKYESLLPNFTLKEKLALEQYLDLHQQISYFFVHIRTATNFPKIWEYTLRRLTPEQLAEVSDSVKNEFPSLKKS